MLSSKRKLDLLRLEMAKRGVDSLVVPCTDQHMSEFVVPWENRLQFITGFTGSAGTAVVTMEDALLWTDGRYFIQAAKQLDISHWTLMKDGLVETPSYFTWISRNPKAKNVGYFPAMTAIASFNSIVKAWGGKSASEAEKFLIPLEPDIIDNIWELEGSRPSETPCQIYVVEAFSKRAPTKEKLASIILWLKEHKFHGCLITKTDEVCWILNMRSQVRNYSPTFPAFMHVTVESTNLYVNEAWISSSARRELEQCQINIRPYDLVYNDLLQCYAQPDGAVQKKLSLDGSSNMKLYTLAQNRSETAAFITPSPVSLPKAIKNEVELDGAIKAHYEDGKAVIEFLCWLSNLSDEELNLQDELTVASKLDALRMRLPTCKGLSFKTISAIGPNSAVIHYDPSTTLPQKMSRKMYLVDSGGQYNLATTDITRTIHLGVPSDFEKTCYTSVLKGHLNLKRHKFPHGTKGYQLDVLAREFLWSIGLDYKHGTGHGVGAFLNVHEGPQNISPIGREKDVALEPGMILSNEPGVYLENSFGIRIENCMYVTRSSGLQDNSSIFYAFEDLTLVPYARDLIDLHLLSNEDIEDINSYHSKVRDIFLPLHKKPLLDEEATVWLTRETEPLS